MGDNLELFLISVGNGIMRVIGQAGVYRDGYLSITDALQIHIQADESGQGIQVGFLPADPFANEDESFRVNENAIFARAIPSKEITDAHRQHKSNLVIPGQNGVEAAPAGLKIVQ